MLQLIILSEYYQTNVATVEWYFDLCQEMHLVMHLKSTAICKLHDI